MKGCFKVVLWIAGILFVIFAGIIIIGSVVDSSPGKAAAIELTDAQVRTQARRVTYEQLMRTPELYQGRPVKFEGEVVQADDGRLRVIVDNPDDKYASDAVYVQYDHQFKILTDDEVTVYGIADGRYSYKTVMGDTMTVPKIIATEVEVK